MYAHVTYRAILTVKCVLLAFGSGTGGFNVFFPLSFFITIAIAVDECSASGNENMEIRELRARESTAFDDIRIEHIWLLWVNIDVK